MLLLLVVAADQNSLQSQVAGGDGGAEAGVSLVELLHDGGDRHALQTQTAELLGNFQAEVTQLSSLVIDLLGELAGDVVFLALFNDLVVAEFTDAVEDVLILGIDQISHVIYPPFLECMFGIVLKTKRIKRRKNYSL